MRKLFLEIIITFALLIHPATVYADNVEKIQFAGSELLYPLPKGFCNITEDFQGIMMMEILHKQEDPMSPTPQLIIGSCQQSKSNPGYPWGWIGLMKGSPTLTQETLNKIMAEMIKNEDLMDKLMENASKSNSDVFEEVFDVELTNESNEQRIIWADENSILVLSNISGQIDGNFFKEINISSTTVLEDLYVYTFLFNLEGANPSIKEMSKLLIDNAPVIKGLN